MDKSKILDSIAPCSLCCYTCSAKQGGVIEETAKKLLHYFEGYYEFNRDTLPQEFQTYTEKTKRMTDRLAKYTTRMCSGCRNDEHGKCCIEGCNIYDCTRSHGVDFCADCSEFPCDKVNEEVFSPIVMEAWKQGNERIRKVGIEQYCEEAMATPHYLAFKDGEE